MGLVVAAVVVLVFALIIYQAYAGERSRRARVAAAAMFARQANVESFDRVAASKILGEHLPVPSIWARARGRPRKEFLYFLSRKEPWGAVYLIDLFVFGSENEVTELRLRCVLRFNRIEIPDFELRPKLWFDRLGQLSKRAVGPQRVSLEAGLLSDAWLLFGHDGERLRELFAGGVAHLFDAIDTPCFEATGGKIFFRRGGRGALSGEDLARFSEEGARLGAAVAAAAGRKS